MLKSEIYTYIEMKEGWGSTVGVRFDLGVLNPGSTINVVIGFNAAHLDQHSGVPRVEISDQKIIYRAAIVSSKDYYRYPPCRVYDADASDGRLVDPDSEVPATYRVTFVPNVGHVYCETGHKNGFTETRVYNMKLDMSMPISLAIVRGKTNDQYLIHFIQVEIF